MSYVVSIVNKPGMSPRTISSNLVMSDQDAKAMCVQLAQSMWRVNLHETSEDGVISIVAAWEKGHRKRKVTTALPVIEAEVSEPTEPVVAALNHLRDAAQEYVTATEDEPAEDEANTYTAYCVKCKEKRDFVGEVHLSESGRRMAKGNCPVCGTKVNTILANLPHAEQDSYDTPDDPPETIPPVVTFSDGEEPPAPAATVAGN